MQDVVLRAGSVDDEAPHAAGRRSATTIPWSWFPAQTEPASTFFPGATFAATDGVTGYNDITPRMGAAYDVFGNGKTALKVNLGKYLQGASVSNLAYEREPGAAHPVRHGLSTTGLCFFGQLGFANPCVTRDWTDFNGNFSPGLRRCRTRLDATATCQADRQPAFGSNQFVGRPDSTRPAQRVGRASVGLVVRRVGAAGALPARVGGSRLLPPIVHACSRRAASVTDNLAVSTERRRHVLPDGADRPASARRRRIPGRAAVQHEPERVRPGEQPDQGRRRTSATTRACSTAWTSRSTSATRGASPSRAAPARARSTTTGARFARRSRRAYLLNPYCNEASPWQTSFRGSVTYTIPTHRREPQLGVAGQAERRHRPDRVARGQLHADRGGPGGGGGADRPSTERRRLRR